jgi:biotin-dependent carboxylase-like uncharacterized protein
VIEIISDGLYTTIQDLGRYGYRRFGVPLSGAMDSYSARLANRLLGNTNREALMEITHIGPVLYFTQKTEIAITGAGFSPTINNEQFPLNTRTFVPENSTIKFGLPGYGLRAYLAVLGGFNSEKTLNSYSQYQGITKKDTLEKGDRLSIALFEGFQSKVTASVKVPKSHFTNESIVVYPGPEFRGLPETIQKKITESKLTIDSQSNRMAYLLKGWESFSAKEIITAPVQPGTVQLTPSGQSIVLMRDAQTTGGYARVLQLPENSINLLAQKKAGDSVVLQIKDPY